MERWIRGKYRLVRELGSGGMAIVYEAVHRNGKRFAVKMLRPEWSMDGHVRGRFVREGYVANAVAHPGAVGILDDDVAEDGSAFLVMELLEGTTLDACIAGHGVLPAEAVLGVLAQLLDVLASAHARGIVHRDIKPANVFLMSNGSVKLLDFGIARLRDAPGSLSATRTGLVMGTPAYMAPEQALGKREEVDARTDLWAVGATAFELLTGRTPHVGETPEEVIVRSATTKADSIATVAPSCPAEIASIVDRALAYDRAQRWPSAAAMRDEVVRVCVASFGRPPSPAELVAALGAPARAPGPAASAPRTTARPLTHATGVTSTRVRRVRPAWIVAAFVAAASVAVLPLLRPAPAPVAVGSASWPSAPPLVTSVTSSASAARPPASSPPSPSLAPSASAPAPASPALVPMARSRPTAARPVPTDDFEHQ